MKPVPIFHAFTIQYNQLSNRIITEVVVSPPFEAPPPPPDLPRYVTTALWDTGATNSVIKRSTAAALALVPVGLSPVGHAGGRSTVNTYLVSFFLPNHVGVLGVLVSECPDEAGDFGAIIGMDIISRGDFSVTNCEGRTCMSFRTPSVETIDYVVDANHLKYAGVPRNAPCPCGRKGPDGKPVKFKNCHGRVNH